MLRKELNLNEQKHVLFVMYVMELYIAIVISQIHLPLNSADHKLLLKIFKSGNKW